MPPPPTPRGNPTIAFFRWMLDPAGRFEADRREVGDICYVKNPVFGPEVLLANPVHIKEAFTADPEILSAGEANRALEAFIGPSSVLRLDGPRHLRMRKLMLPPFHGERMILYGQVMIEVTRAVLAAWPEGKPFPLHPHMQRITLEIILRTIFGVDEGARMIDLRDQLARLLDRVMSPLGVLFLNPTLQWDLGAFTPWGRMIRERERADALLYALIARRREEQGAGRQDILSMLLDVRDEEGRAMSDDELRDQLITLLSAGHETTATGLCWAFEQLLSHPEALDRALAEIDAATAGGPLTPEALGRLDYLDAVIKETLRLRPVIPAVSRRVMKDTQIGGYDVHAGVLLVLCAYLAQRHPDSWPDPTRFRPERFIDKKPDPYAWFPFGGGMRRCIGLAFALYEMKAVMATILSSLRVRMARPGLLRVRLRAFTFAPEGGAPVVVERRRPRA